MKYSKIQIVGDITACDPGINNTSSYEGEALVSDLKEGQVLDTLIENMSWHDLAGYKYKRVIFVKATEEGVTLKYGDNEIQLKDKKYLSLGKTGLSYAYAELFVRLQ